eukprot:TRINITY_DN55315_c0_g1_i1.p1 TRINITY_DN55315_c0_g1~~TRINITY_DN55315_c0_g1_i1.p1  ORF type:complete len:622 (+),score=266.10 TRINITY_DN55315_c0_g1_i1:98-1867(+)
MAEAEKFLKGAVAGQVTDVLAHIIKEHPADGLRLFESLAHFAREGKLVPDAKASPYLSDQPKPRSQLPEGCFGDMQWAKTFAELVHPPKPKPKPKDPDAEEEAEPEPEEEPEQQGEMTDVVAEQETFNSVGEGLGEQTSFRVMVSLKRLLDKEPLKTVRFWGKIQGFARPSGSGCRPPKDYYIAEAEIDPERVQEKEGDEGGGEEEGEAAGKGPETIFKTLNTYKAPKAPALKPEEAGGPGSNKYKYYVTTSDDMCKWVALPDVLPQHVLAARKIKKYFTGDLDAPVHCHPPFPGVEKHYLRAQIARITHACKVAPKGTFTVEAGDQEADEDAPKVQWLWPPSGEWQVQPYAELPPMEQPEPDDRLELPEGDEGRKELLDEKGPAYMLWGEGFRHDKLMEVDNWIHIEPALLRSQGRSTEFKPEPDEEEAADEGAEEEEPPPEIKEPINPLCSALSRDDPIVFSMHSKQRCPPWAVRRAHCQPTEAAVRTYLVRSLRWPGACCYASVRDRVPGSQFCNIYIGNGLKGGDPEIYSPDVPGTMATEFSTKGLTLQTDATPDDEAEFQPPPEPPADAVGGDEEEGDEGGDEE